MEKRSDPALPVLVFGATGQVGRSVLAQGRQQGHYMLAASRKRLPPQPEMGHVDWLTARLADGVPELPPVRAIFSLGPLDLFAQWLGQWPKPANPTRIVALGSMSVLSKKHSPRPQERQLASRLREAESRLSRRCDELGLMWTVLRPTLLWGAGMDRSLSPMARRAMRWHWMPQPAARGLRQPVHVDDVAAAVWACLSCDAAAGQCIAIGGGERLPASEMFARVRHSLPSRTLLLPLPAQVSRAARWLAAVHPAASAMARLQEDLVADNQPLRNLLGVSPRAFAPQQGDWLPREPDPYRDNPACS